MRLDRSMCYPCAMAAEVRTDKNCMESFGTWLRSVPWSQQVWHLFRDFNDEEMNNTKTKPINSWFSLYSSYLTSTIQSFTWN